MRRLLVATAAIALVLICAVTGLADTASNKKAAQADVQKLLSALQVPGTQTETFGQGAAGAGDPRLLTPPLTVDYASAGRLWSSTLNPRDTIAAVISHLPANVRVVGPTTAGTTAAGTASAVLYWPAVPHQLNERAVTLAASSLSGGTTSLRATAFSAWYVTRAPASRVHSGARLMTVSVGGPEAIPETFSVTAPATIAHVVALVNRLVVLQPAATGCPKGTNILLSFAFTAPGKRKPTTTVTASMAGCDAVNVILGHAPQVTLTDPNRTLATYAQCSIGVRVAATTVAQWQPISCPGRH